MYQTTFTQTQIENVRTAAIGLLEITSTKSVKLSQERLDKWFSQSPVLDRLIETGIVQIGPDGHADVEFMKVSTTNRKLHELAKATGLYKTQVVAIDGLAGITCPFADICKAWVVTDENGKRSLEKSPNCEFTCYAAKLEAVYTNVYDAHKHNTDIVNRTKDVELLAALILASIWHKSPSILKKGGIVRWHASGDFHKKHYTEAAALVALAAPEIIFFGYSKSPWVVQALTNNVNSWMVHSHGSKFDDKAEAMGLPQNYVRCDDTQYTELPTACPTSMVADDFFFIRSQKSFAINVH